jgi:hypothetical protein
MMKYLAGFISFLLCIFFLKIYAQSDPRDNLSIPLKSNASPGFADDIIIHDQPGRDQRNVAICSAFNGWLYAVYSYFDGLQGCITLLRSEDNGLTWSVLLDGSTGTNHTSIMKVDILGCGFSISDLKVFIGYCIYDSIHEYRIAGITRYNGISGEIEEEILQDYSIQIKDLSLSSDFLYPAAGSNPYSIAAVYSKKHVFDSIVFCSSSNGGMSFDSRIKIASSASYFGKVSLAYGRSPSFGSGRYFAAWEEKQDEDSPVGHIYTAHSEPSFNSSFTTPVCLDSLDPGTINKLRNPSIACQFNAVDNDSSNLTEIILCEKFNPVNNNYDVTGFYNKKATTSDNFQTFSIASKLQPDISFNPFDSTFMITYFDSALQKLPFLTNNFNLQNPFSWNVVSAGYNDSSNLASPHPKVRLDFGEYAGMNVWTAERTGGNGEALFDAPFHYYTGIPREYEPGTFISKAFPVPASRFVIVEFDLPEPENVNIVLLTPLGQSLNCITNRPCSAGIQKIKVDLTDFSPGMYFYLIRAGECTSSGKIIKK